MSIRLDSDGLSFLVYSPDRSTFFFREVRFDYSRPFAESLKELFFANEIFTYHYKQINVVCTSHQYSLIPEKLYMEKQKERLLAFDYTTIGKVFANHVPALASCMLFDLDKEVFGFCSRELICPEFIHQLNPLLPDWQHNSRQTKGKQLYLLINKDSFFAVGFEQGELFYSNSFTYNDQQDLQYFILFIWKHLQLDQAADEMHIGGLPQVVRQITDFLYHYLKNVFPLKTPSEAYLIDLDASKIPLDLLTLAVCES